MLAHPSYHLDPSASMALPNLNLSLSLQPHSLIHNTSLSKPPCLLSGRPASFPSLKFIPRHHRAVAKDNASLSSIMTELERQNIPQESNEGLTQPGQPPSEHLAGRWRELHGRDDWAGLLDPMDPQLRTELIRYGEFAQASYDAFDFDPFSSHCGSSKYPPPSIFPSLGLDSAGYDISRYLYATSNINLPNFGPKSRRPRTWTKRASWVGYVAVSGDQTTQLLGRRDILVAWRGTVTQLEWVADLMDFLKPVADRGFPCQDRGVKFQRREMFSLTTAIEGLAVMAGRFCPRLARRGRSRVLCGAVLVASDEVESGFMDYYTDKDSTCRFCKYSAREQVLAEVKRLVELYTNAGEEVSITVTGHSLGSALAKLSAYDMAETGVNVGVDGERLSTCVISFSGPRVGNVRFKERFEELGIKALRVVNVHDSVPKVPGIFYNEHVPEFVKKVAEGLPWSYTHVGVELALDHKHSPFLNDTVDPAAFHNLEALLHLIDGYHGRGMKFVLATGRDPALVNKASNFLKDHLMVPPYWRQDENKGMIRSSDGRWIVAERPKLDDHSESIDHHLRQLGLDS